MSGSSGRLLDFPGGRSPEFADHKIGGFPFRDISDSPRGAGSAWMRVRGLYLTLRPTLPCQHRSNGGLVFQDCSKILPEGVSGGGSAGDGFA